MRARKPRPWQKIDGRSGVLDDEPRKGGRVPVAVNTIFVYSQ